MTELESQMAWQHLERQPWMQAGIRLLVELRADVRPALLNTAAWIVPPAAVPAGLGETSVLGVPIRVVDGVTPHLGFDLITDWADRG